MSLELERSGGHFNVELGMIAVSTDGVRMGTLAEQTALFILSLLCYDRHNEVPLSGFPAGTDFGLVVSTGDLTADVSAGWGVFYDSSLVSPSGDNFELQSYQPLVLSEAVEVELDPHDATHPRWDIVVIKSDRVLTDSATRRVKNPATLTSANQSVDLRSRWGAEVLVVPGTPAASPAEPSVPAGYMKLARAEVPAVSGAATWRDTRPILELGSLLKGQVGENYARNFIPDPTGAPNALLVEATSPTSMAVTVRYGTAVIRGIERFYARQTLAVTAAHASLDRIDRVVAKEDGTLAVVAGTPHASPSAPVAPAQSISLALIDVPAADTAIGAGQITDLRSSYVDGADWVPGSRAPFGDAQFDQGVLNHSKLSVPEVFVKLGTPVVTGHLVEIPIELFYPDQTTEYSGPWGENACAFLVEVFHLVDGGGSIAAAYPEFAADFTPNASASYLPLDLRNVDAEDVEGVHALWFAPTTGSADDVNENGTASRCGRHIFWMEERTGTIKLEASTALVSGSTDFLFLVRPIGRPGGCVRKTCTITY